MKRHIPGLHRGTQTSDSVVDGLFLVRVERAFYRWHPQKPFFSLRFNVLEPKECNGQTISGRIYCTPKALWKLSWFLRDVGYDGDLLGRDEVDARAPPGLRGVLRVSPPSLTGRSCLTPEAFPTAGQWAALSVAPNSTEEI